MSNIKNRFDLLIFETAEEYIKRKFEEKQKLKAEVREERIKVEKKGVCEGCGEYYDGVGRGERLRWTHNNEFYVCQECFMNDLQCQCDIMYPPRSIDTEEGYDEYIGWDCYWEDEQQEKKAYCREVCSFSRDVYQGDYFCDHFDCPLEDVIIEFCDKRG